NMTPQFAFIDDGIVVPGTSGTPGLTWVYGPGGYATNLLGGLAGPFYHLDNEIWSPVIEWPEGDYTGCELSFDVYRHQVLTNGLFYTWDVTSSIDGGVTWDIWQDRSFCYYGGPDYLRSNNVVTDLMLPDRNAVRISFGAYEIGWIWNMDGLNPTPAPYFDNVAFKIYGFDGPAITAREIDLAQDNFPTNGELDLANPGNNDVRFDMARNIANHDQMLNLPGDSIVVNIVTTRTGSILNERPKLFWSMKQNPFFNPYRTNPASLGWAYGDSTYNSGGTLVPDRWSVDLPDEDFLYPGDILHYYIEAQDNVAGNIGTTYLPGNLDGFGVFHGDDNYIPLQWSSSFTVHALPTITDDQMSQTEILFWNDFGNQGGQSEWYSALGRLGVDYDIYYTNGPSSGVGNGLGGRATPLQLSGYETILYSSGDLSLFTLSNGDYQEDPSNDVYLLDSWLQTGNKNLLLAGDNIVSDLMSSGSNSESFVSTWLSLNFLGNNIRLLIDNQTSPQVIPIPGNPISHSSFVAYGGCPFATFDIVEPMASAQRIAEFTAPDSSAGAYSYAAGIYNQNMNSNIVYFPVDFSRWYTPADYGSGTSARTDVLSDILLFFGHPLESPVTDIPANTVFTLNCFPNPFNPITKVCYNMPIAGNLKVVIYNIKGEQVCKLLDHKVEEGLGSLYWNGRNEEGSEVASGVYFVELKNAQSRLVDKIMLIK
ncbi:hypothetical protein HOD41_09455, partial [bacterium]|nr:hypothetical protein [bacterium]